MNDNQLTDKETTKLKDVLDRIEAEFYDYFSKINGGFAIAKVFDYDQDWIDVEVQSGIQNGCEDTVHTDQLRVDRHTWEVHDG